MRYLIIILFVLSFNLCFAQTRPSGFPTQSNLGWQKWGWAQSDSGLIVARRDTNFLARFSGTMVFRPADRTYYYYDSTDLRWLRLSAQPDSSFVYVDYIPQASPPPYSEGRLWYDNSTNTLSFYDGIEGTSLQIGQENVVYARNNTGSQIDNGQTVYVSGSLGQNPTVALAQANEFNTARTLGVATHDIANNTTGKITTFGLVNDINTSMFSAGDKLYLSSTSAGELTNAVPDTPNYVLFIGICLTSHVSQGKIFVDPQRTAIRLYQITDTSFVFDEDTLKINIPAPAIVNVGSGVGIFKDKIISTYNFKSLTEGYGINIADNTNDVGIEIDTNQIATQYDLTQIGSTNSNIGSGFRWAVPNTNNIKTVFSDITGSWDSTSNANALTYKVDTSVIATQYDLTQIQGTQSLNYKNVAFGGIDNVMSPGEVSFQYDSITNKLTVDSVDLNQSRQDSSLFRRLSTYLASDTLFADGNSITVGLNASPITDSAYAYLIANRFGVSINNIASSGTGMVSIANRFLINKNPDNTVATVIMGGLNDGRRNGSARKTLNKIINGHKAIFANQYLKGYTNAGTGGVNVTRYGSWTNSWSAAAEGGKTTVGAYTSTTNDSITYAFTDSTVIIGLMGGDGSASSYIGTDVDVYIDGVLDTTINTNDQTDGVADGSGLDNKRCAMAFYFGGLSYTAHSIKLVKKSTGGGGFLICDYFGHFVDNSESYLMLWMHAPYLTAVGYATSPSSANNSVIDSINNKIDSLMTTNFISWYPTYRVETNSCYDTTSGTDVDGIHPNNTGHTQMYTCALNALNSVNGSGGTTGKVYYGSEFHGIVEGQDDIFLMLTKGDLRYIQNQTTTTQTASFTIGGTGTANKFITGGTVFGSLLSTSNRQTNGFVGGTASGGPFFGIRNNSNATDDKTYDWFLGSNGIQFRILSDDLGTSADYLRMRRTGMTIDTLEVPKLNIVGNLKVYTHSIVSNKDSALIWDRSDNEYKIAKINSVPSFTGLAYNSSGTLSAATIGDLLQLSGSTIDFNTVYMDNAPNNHIALKSRMHRQSFTVADADFTTLNTRQEGYFILPEITASRTFDLFTGSGVDGVEFFIYNLNTSGTFVWTFSGGTIVKASDTSTPVTALPNGSLYHILGTYDGSTAKWIIVNQ